MTPEEFNDLVEQLTQALLSRDPEGWLERVERLTAQVRLAYFQMYTRVKEADSES